MVFAGIQIKMICFQFILLYSISYFAEEKDTVYGNNSYLEIVFNPFRSCEVSIAGFTIGFGEKAEEIIHTNQSSKWHIYDFLHVHNEQNIHDKRNIS